MLDNAPIKVGDELVECGKVYKVFKIEDKKTYDGKVESHIFFKPVYATNDNKTVYCAIPLRSINQANIRRPLDKKRMTEILGFTTELVSEGGIFDINEAKEILKRNNPETSAQVLKIVWRQIHGDQDVTKSKRDMFDLSLKSLAQEVALTFGLSLEKAEAKLQGALKKALA